MNLTTRKKLKNLVLSFLLCSSASFSANASLIDIEFLIDGNTWDFPFIVQNNSDAGLKLERFSFDLRPKSNLSLCFDEVGSNCHFSGGLSFTPVPGDDVGYTSYSVIDAPGGISSLDLLTVDFSGFDPGESFAWKIDVDDQPDGSVFGNDLIGSLFLIDMSDGLTYQGVLESVSGNNDASQLRLTGIGTPSIVGPTEVPEPGSILAFGSLMLAFCLRKRIFSS